MAETSSTEHRREHFRRGVIMLLLAILLLFLALLLFGNAPDWNADGSRDAYPTWARALLCASVIMGTMFMPLGARSLLLAALPNQALAVVLGIVVGVFGLGVVPVELWLALAITDTEPAGERERQENSGDWDWD
jgi:hypothetical protein